MNRTAYIEQLRAEMRDEHLGLFITGPGELSLMREALPERYFQGAHVITRSLGNCRCTSDSKAIKQFTGHARVPNAGTPVALGHECIQVVVDAPDDTDLTPGDLVLITPGHASYPIDTETFEPQPDGTLPSLGYSYRYAGGLRQYSALPKKGIDILHRQGFGELFNKLPVSRSSSLATLAHAEAFACCYGSNLPIYTLDAQGDFRMGIPPRAILALLGGTARMALINLSIIAAMPAEDLPQVIYLTGSRAKLDELEHLPLIGRLRAAGISLVLIDRTDPTIIERLTEHGRPQVVWTNFDAQEVYDQASQIIAEGGNINNYAGARDSEIGFTMPIAASTTDDPAHWLGMLHHGKGAIEYERLWGPRAGGVLRFIDCEPALLRRFLAALPSGHKVQGVTEALLADFPELEAVEAEIEPDDVLIGSRGAQAAASYAAVECHLARGAAVAFLRGACTIRIRSRNAHYKSIHQICGDNVPWYMTNTSIPTAEDMAIQGVTPIDFDWLVVSVAGLAHTRELYDDTLARQPMGSFFTLCELPDLPYVQVSAAAFQAKAAEVRATDPTTATALEQAAAVLATNGDEWSRAVEAALYAGYGKPYPLDL